MLLLNLLALVAAPLAAQAFDVVTPTQWLANTTVTINWTSITTDPEVFSIELYHPVLLPTGPIGIADTVDAFLFTVNIPLPRVTPGDGYSFGFVNVGNINQVYAKSGFFPILQNDINGSSQLSSSAAATSNSRSQGPTTATATTSTNGTTTAAALTSTSTSKSSTPTAAASVNTDATAQPSQFGSGTGFASFSSPSKWSLIPAIGVAVFASL